MIKRFILLTLISFAILISCNDPKKSKEFKTPTQLIDTTKSIKISSYWITPKSSFDINTFSADATDTLSIVTCSEYVYAPFGEINSKGAFKSSLLKNFSVKNRVDTTDVGEAEFNILKLNRSRIIFFFDNDPEASKHSYIYKGEIYDSNVKFVNGIKIGMTKKEFFQVFFDQFPDELLLKYNQFLLESCILDITHFYSFKDNKLQSVRFITDSYWQVSY